MLPQFVFLEGQAGQGKTTLAAQLLHQRSMPFCWYRMEEPDQLAPFFLGALLAGLKEAVPGFNTPVDASVQAAAITSEQCPRLLAAILSRFPRRIGSGFILVLDDVHAVLPSGDTPALLHTLIDHAPPSLHIVFIARRNLEPIIANARRHGSVLSLDSRSLAFSTGEIASLFNSVFQVPLTLRAVQALRRITDGWVMGLHLTARNLQDKESADIERELESLWQNRDEIFDYLLRQVLSDLSADKREFLLAIALLEDIPVGLAELLTGCEKSGEILREMAADNCFITPLDKERTVFVLHHLFQAGLRQQAWQEKGGEEIRRLLGLAAEWYLEREPDRAIRYLLAAEDYPRAEAALRQAGLHFRPRRRLMALCPDLEKLPRDIFANYPWFAYYCGLGFMGEEPGKAFPPLQLAYNQFVSRGDSLGELLAGAQLILFSVAINGNYANGYPFLDRTMVLLDLLADTLPPLVLGHIANVAVLANTFICYNPHLAERFLDVGLDIALEENLVSLEVEARVARLFYLTFSGDWHRCCIELEAALPLLHNPLSSQLHRGAMFIAFIGFIKASGDADAYERHKALYRTQFAPSVRENSIGEAYVLYWDLQMYLACGDRKRAEATLKAASLMQGAAAGPHLRNLFMQYAALLAAEAGKRDEALAAMSSARELRSKAGGLYFCDLNDAFNGTTLDMLGQDEEALACFDRALSNPSPYLRETTLAFRAWFRLRRGDPGVQDDLRELLTSMRMAGHGQFYGWMPEMMRELLSVAITEGIEKVYAQELAAQRLDSAVLEDGSIIPLLHIATFGTMRFKIGERIILSETDLSESQRHILAILLSQTEPSCPQKRLQLLLWPESDETRSRNNFDKLLSRLRKSFEATMGEDARHYLQLKHGILSLCHCRIDAGLFMVTVHQGKKHFRQGEFWQAENLLYKATALYKGDFLPCAPDSDLVEIYRCKLLEAYVSAAILHAEVLVKLQQPQQAIEILEQSLLADPLHDDTVKKLYSLLILNGNPVRAQMIVKRYGQALLREGYQPPEIHEILDNLWR
jgi:DNA-binding SARP family transcriptional activator